MNSDTLSEYVLNSHKNVLAKKIHAFFESGLTRALFLHLGFLQFIFILGPLSLSDTAYHSSDKDAVNIIK